MTYQESDNFLAALGPILGAVLGGQQDSSGSNTAIILQQKAEREREAQKQKTYLIIGIISLVLIIGAIFAYVIIKRRK
jgi:hypothetical protein